MCLCERVTGVWGGVVRRCVVLCYVVPEGQEGVMISIFFFFFYYSDFKILQALAQRKDEVEGHKYLTFV